MLAAVTAAKTLDWSSWLRGIVGAVISGGAGAVSSGFGTIIIDSKDFNIGNGGTGHLFELMGVCFCFNGLISLTKFLQTMPVPDKLSQALDKAASANKEVAVAVQQAKAVVEDSKGN